MKFINLLGNTRMFINVQNISFIEETNDGCKIYFVGDGKYIITDANYDELTSAISKMSGGGEGGEDDN